MDPMNLDEGTYRAGGGEIKTWDYFGQYTIAAATADYSVFANAAGSPNFTRIDQANLPLAGQIPSSQKLVIKGFGLEYVGGAAKADANTIAIRKWLATTVLQFGIQDKSPMLQMRLSRMMGLSLGLFSDPTTAAEPVFATTREVASPVFMLERPITLAAQTPFTCLIRPGVAAAAQQVTDGDILYVSLIGDLWSKSG